VETFEDIEVCPHFEVDFRPWNLICFSEENQEFLKVPCRISKMSFRNTVFALALKNFTVTMVKQLLAMLAFV